MEMDATLYDKCARESVEKVRMRDAEREASQVMWATLIAAAAAKEHHATTGHHVAVGHAVALGHGHVAAKGHPAAIGHHVKH